METHSERAQVYRQAQQKRYGSFLSRRYSAREAFSPHRQHLSCRRVWMCEALSKGISGRYGTKAATRRIWETKDALAVTVRLPGGNELRPHLGLSPALNGWPPTLLVGREPHFSPGEGHFDKRNLSSRHPFPMVPVRLLDMP